MEYKLGQMIDHFRKARSLTMDELGEMLGKTTSTVSRWVNGSRSPKVEDLIKLTKIFNTDVNTLLYGDEALTKNKVYRFYADNILSLNIEHFFNLQDDHFLKVPVPDFLMRNKNHDNTFLTRVYDEAMNRTIPTNSIISVDTDPNELQDGSIVLCYYDNSIKLRRYIEMKKDLKVKLLTDRLNGENQGDVLLKKDVLILGKITVVFSDISD